MNRIIVNKNSFPLKNDVTPAFKGQTLVEHQKTDVIAASFPVKKETIGCDDGVCHKEKLYDLLQQMSINNGWQVSILKAKAKKPYIKPDIPDVKYQNMFKTRLKATPNPNFKKELNVMAKAGKIHDVEKAFLRITSLSRYLKEDMVGFITPDGRHWFEGACKYIIKGTACEDISESDYKKYAMKFWQLMVKADNYWTSDKFVNYLESMNQDDAGVKATLESIKSIQKENHKRSSNISFGYKSDLKYIPKLLNDGCGYTGESFSFDSPETIPSLEHLFPHHFGGDEVNDDCNYILVSPESNRLRWHIPLTAYLSGWDGDEYLEAGLISKA